MIKKPWYKEIMKLPKRVYLIVAIAIFVSGGATALALVADKPVDKVKIEQVSSTTPALNPEEAPAEQPTSPTEQPAVEPEPEPQPVETVQSVLDAQGWNETQKTQCLSVILAEKPEYFKDVETTKKTIEVLKHINPCYLVAPNSNGPILDKMKWYHTIDRPLGNPPPNQQMAQ